MMSIKYIQMHHSSTIYSELFGNKCIQYLTVFMYSKPTIRNMTDLHYYFYYYYYYYSTTTT